MKTTPKADIIYDIPDSNFDNLMLHRIYNVLFIASEYDAFILEKDGRIDEQIFNEYMKLNLRHPPHLIHAPNEHKARKILKKINIDLVIIMYTAGENNLSSFAKEVKEKYKNLPVVALTPFPQHIISKLKKKDITYFDYVFSWLGNADIMLAIIKLLEDKMNLKHDVLKVGVQVILLVEDSIRFYSSYLPNIYKIVFKQSKEFMAEGLNEHEKMLRMRGRPKIILATNYEEAKKYFDDYKDNMLGIITDVRYEKDGVEDEFAGVKLIENVREEDKFMSILMQSSEEKNASVAKELHVGFINKSSKNISRELKNFMQKYFAFGDFIFINPDTGEEIGSASNIKTLMEKMQTIPDESLRYHINNNHFTKWLMARACFPVARLFKELSEKDFNNLEHVRKFMLEVLAKYRISKSHGVIAEFTSDHFDGYFTFARIGNGSIGGKARGLAFLDQLLQRHKEFAEFGEINISIPRTLVICTDIFDEFMESNSLYSIALSNAEDEEILDAFVKAKLPQRIKEDLKAFLEIIDKPLAIRSSSVLEDSYYQPFAGIYSTYMIPYTDDHDVLIKILFTAIKSVYASAYYKDSKAYMTATSNMIDEEKMAIVLQEVCGEQHGNIYFPTISGVARSINFYPIGNEKFDDGIASIAFGLGKYIVEGHRSLRFSPKHPYNILQLSTTEMTLRDTQKNFYALDTNPNHFKPSIDEGINIMRCDIDLAAELNAVQHVISYYDYNNGSITGMMPENNFTRLVTFANVLKYDIFPLAKIIELILNKGHQDMNRPVEIEFAVDFSAGVSNANFNILQIRPIVDNDSYMDEELTQIPEEQTILTSKKALGQGVISGIKHILYVKPQNFNPAKSPEIARMIGEINSDFIKNDTNYVLIGPGRWGSSDPWLGIPTKWANISNAKLIVESSLNDYRIEPSQGTHFFQNLTSLGVGYFTINPYIQDGFFNIEFLDNQPAVFENEYLRLVKFDKNLTIKIDGRKTYGLVMV
ncbi:PEP/pyruvate-binding domain-containing protein [Bacteroidales bacterium OttesenSCG-928-K03]|nr:PEP/pyruvate-binding domain-containing protein [Odoribacter sp. OttesenSCG-928-L07]MDL2239807.1 PEP/pyruvate-binding domain-containing protein [Bacteroidales bacterium OttesenSCG-928-L14]MDL2241148.1 PEP/pyruvate-binding domain-containing protein [Bacteroidales bacterium OttesenSCG-928-K22]MDL2243029.1 PEP/pyruvate-binding domain-containing protein [Bacteroidales bacterium OttesenSCG-928-K03]